MKVNDQTSDEHNKDSDVTASSNQKVPSAATKELKPIVTRGIENGKCTLSTTFKMARRINSNRLSYLIILLLQSFSFALRDYKIVYNSIKCTASKSYVESVSCWLATNSEKSVVNIDLQMKKEAQQVFIDATVYIWSPKRKPSIVFKVERADFCAFYNEKSPNWIVNAMKDMNAQHSNVPDCPVAADYHYQLKNASADSEYLPFFVPRVTFKSVVVFYDKRTFVVNITTVAKIVNNKSNKKSERTFKRL